MAQEHHILGALDEGKGGELLDQPLRAAHGEAEVEGLERLYAGKPASLASIRRVLSARKSDSAFEYPFEEVGEARLIAHRVLAAPAYFGEHPLELELLAELPDPLGLQVHRATSASSSP